MKQWMVKGTKIDVHAISKSLGISPFLVQLMAQRDIPAEDMKSFLDPSVDDIYPQTELKGTEDGCRIIIRAIESGKKIRIVGDYDVDGVTSTAIWYRSLRHLTSRVDYRIPHRVKDGYGINPRMVQEAADDGIDLIITCDNGISALEAVNAAKEKGILLVITDHHQLKKRKEGDKIEVVIPEADAVINPQQPGDQSGFQTACGGFVSYLTVDALYRRLHRDLPMRMDLMILAGLATVCDVMMLQRQNRALVRYALEHLTESSLPGLQAFIADLNLTSDGVDGDTFGFQIGPRLNSAGRLEDAMTSARLLISDDPEECRRITDDLNRLNRERQRMTGEAVNEAERIIEKENLLKDPVLVLCMTGVHESLAGLVAGRLRETYYRPVFVFSETEGILKGSGRSIDSYDMFQKMSEIPELFVRFGGHKLAAGCSVRPENFDALRRELNIRCGLTDDDLIEKIYIDAPLHIKNITIGLAEILKKMEPYGSGNDSPQFGIRNVEIRSCKFMGSEGRYTRLTLDDGTDIKEAVMFRQVEQLKASMQTGRKFDFLFEIGINTFNQRKTVQMKITDFRPAHQ